MLIALVLSYLFFVAIVYLVYLWFRDYRKLQIELRTKESSGYQQELTRLKEVYEKRVLEQEAKADDLREMFQSRIEKLEAENEEWRDRTLARNNYLPIKPENRPSTTNTEYSTIPHKRAQEKASERFLNDDFPEIELEDE